MSDVNLERIGWQNGTLTSKAKVEIGGVIYEVEPEEYSGSTPLSAENLIQMEDNIEDAIDTVSAKLMGTTLYENSNGTTSTVTLSEDISNMKRLRISGFHVYSDIAYHFCQEFDVILDGKTSLFAKSQDGATNSYACTEVLTLNSTSITRGSQYLIPLNGNTRIDTTIYITKVIGYKY